MKLWGVRIAGLLMLLLMLAILFSMQKRLLDLQRQRGTTHSAPVR